MDGKLLRWTVPASLPCYADREFRVHPGTFDLHAAPVVAAFRAFVADQRRAKSLRLLSGGGYRSYLDHIAGLDWLEDALRRADLVVWDWPRDLVWHLAGELVYSGRWARVSCPSYAAAYQPGAGRVVAWRLGSGMAASGGRRYVCPAGHTLYAMTEWNS